MLTDILIKKLCKNVRGHNTIQTAYRMEGVTDKEFAQLMRAADDESDEMAVKLKAGLDRAAAEAEAEGVAALNLLANDGHAAAIMWRQERRYADQWAKADSKSTAKDSNASTAPILMIPTNGRETPQS